MRDVEVTTQELRASNLGMLDGRREEGWIYYSYESKKDEYNCCVQNIAVQGKS